MEDDRIKELFSDFEPSLTPSHVFMGRLQRSLEAVEVVRRENAALRRRSRIAVAIAAVAGFLTGVILTMLYPFVSGWLSAVSISLPMLDIPPVEFDGRFIAWVITGVVSVLIAVNTYEIALARLMASQIKGR